MQRALVTILALSVTTCAAATTRPRHATRADVAALRQAETPALTFGDYQLAAIVDGDTIRVAGLDASLRLLGVDSEETFKSTADRELFQQGWTTYLARKQAGAKRPVKMATPMGEAAKTFAKSFFADVTTVTLERDHPAEIRDRFNRYLAYVLVRKAGRLLNYNVELVRAGMSPYFSKYGYSQRYHADFLQAEAEARAASRGIWATGAQAYPDYDARRAWWNARGEFVSDFRTKAKAHDNHIDVTQWDAAERLERALGKPVVVLGLVGDVRLTTGPSEGPSRVMLSRRIGADLPLIFFDRDVLAQSGAAAWRGEFVIVRGTPSRYTNRHTGRSQVQLVIDAPSQITLSPIPGLTKPATLTPEPPNTPVEED